MPPRRERGKAQFQVIDVERLFDPVLDTLPVQTNYARDPLALPILRCRITPATGRCFAVEMTMRETQSGRTDTIAQWTVPAEVWQQVFMPIFDQAHRDGKLSIMYAYE